MRQPGTEGIYQTYKVCYIPSVPGPVRKLPLNHYFYLHHSSTLAFLSEVLAIPTGDVIILDEDSTPFIDILIYYAFDAVDQSGLYIIKNEAVFLSN